jgi:uncharacterized protein YndB with AHSA1/START domain
MSWTLEGTRMTRIIADKVNGIGSKAVKARTGKSWPEWAKVLDAAGARAMTHQEIIAHLAERHGVGPWWQQMVTVGYEHLIGRRIQNQTTAGFQVSRSKTIAASANEAYAAWKDKRRRGQWLADTDFTIRTTIAAKSMRITWVDGKSSLEVAFYEKGPGKCQVVVSHTKLADRDQAERMKAYWTEQLGRLNEMLER